MNSPEPFFWLERLENLRPLALLDAVADAIGMPEIDRPSKYETHSKRALAVLEWVLAENGCGLEILAERWGQFRRHLSLPPPPLPAHFLDREDALARLKELVLSGERGPVGVQGMGGVGKSVLAAALAHDRGIHDHFTDGVFWLTVGQSLQLLSLQARLAQAAGDEAPAFQDVHEGVQRLRELFGGKRALVILDDVWDGRQAAAFQALDEFGRLVLTTRDAGLLTSLGACEHRLGVLAEEQSLELLADWSGQPRAALARNAAVREVIRQCGRLPLALAVCGAMVREGNLWEDVRDALAAADLESLDKQFPDYPHLDVLRSLAVGVEFLAREDPQAAERYRELAVFPADALVPESAVATLWSATGKVPPNKSRPLLVKLDRKALLTLEGEAPHRRILLHDLQHDFLTGAAGDLPRLHETLLGAYQSQCPDGWHTGKDDGYFFDQLIHHLRDAGREEEARRLLLNPRWMDAKLHHRGARGLLADYEDANDATLQLVQEALRLSSHVLEQQPEQLPSQLVGRLLARDEPEIDRIIGDLHRFARQPWLRPLTESLTGTGGPLLRTIAGLEHTISALALTGDGKTAVLAAAGTLSTWDVERGEERSTIRSPAGAITSLAMTPDGRTAITGHVSGAVVVWDLEHSQVRCVQEHVAARERHAHRIAVAISPDAVARSMVRQQQHAHRIAVAISPDGGAAVSASKGLMKSWDVEHGQMVGTFAMPDSGNRAFDPAVAISGNGRTAISSSGEKALLVWDLASGEHAALPAPARVCSVALTPDGQIAAAGCVGGYLAVWRLGDDRPCLTLAAHGEAVRGLALTPDGQRAITAGKEKPGGDGGFKAWDLTLGKEVLSLPGHSDGASAMAISDDGRVAISDSEFAMVKVWSLERAAASTVEQPAAADWVRLVNHGETAVFGTRGGGVELCEFLTGAARDALPLEAAEGMRALPMTPDGRYAFARSPFLAHKLIIWDFQEAKIAATLPDPPERVTAAAFLQEGRLLALGGEHGAVMLYDPARDNLEVVHRMHGDVSIDSIAAAAGTPRIVARDQRGGVTMCDLHTASPGWLGARRVPADFTISADGKFVLEGDWLGVLHLWNLEQGEETEHNDGRRRAALPYFAGLSPYFAGLKISADGFRAVAGTCFWVNVWDLKTQRILAEFTADAPLVSCDASDDLTRIAAVDAAGRRHRWCWEEGNGV